MARIRSIKPDFFRHEGLYEAEVETGLPLRVAFAGMWTVADREGRFRWRPRIIKLDVLPFDNVDFGSVLEALATRGFIVKYEIGGEIFGQIPGFARHQLIGRDELPSDVPAPDGSLNEYDKPPNATIRRRIYERDRFSCSYCGRDMKNDSRAICLDHVIPYARGGTNRELNLVTACKPCNAKKQNRTPIEAGMAWPSGMGESYKDGPLTGGHQVADKEGKGREQEGKGKGIETAQLTRERDMEPPPSERGRVDDLTLPTFLDRTITPSRKAELDEIESRLRGAAGLENDPSPGLLDLSPIIGLIDAGYRLTEDILTVIRAKARPGVKTWRYFLPAIEQAKQSNQAIAPKPVDLVTKSVVWIGSDSQEWREASARHEREKGKPPSVLTLRNQGSPGNYFPADWLSAQPERTEA